MFVIPMAGESRRFREAGFTDPKYRLTAHGAPVFDHAVNSFAAYFATDAFLFVVRGAETEDFVARRCEALGIAQASIVRLDRLTVGQAETVLLGLDGASVDDGESIAIFNIDTFRPAYRKPPHVKDPGVAGYLEVFRGGGEGWSFVAPDPARAGAVAEVAERRRSRICAAPASIISAAPAISAGPIAIRPCRKARPNGASAMWRRSIIR